MEAIDILVQARRLIYKSVVNLSPAALLAVPPGFDNNIAWNVGHILVVQQLLHYRLSGLEMQVTEAEVGMYRTGTSPADWEVEPKVALLLPLLAESAQRLGADYEAGRFAHYRAYTTSTGFRLSTIEDALAFNNFHEGLHLGAILSLRNVILADKS